jgi:two-component system response regulator FixJ
VKPHTIEQHKPAQPEADKPLVRVIDDDSAVRESIELLLRTVGLACVAYDSPEAFLDDLDLRRAGCIVLDIRMPRMSGLALQDVLIERGSDLPIVFITGHGDVPLAVKAMRAGAADFLEKPLHDQTLLDAIHAALERHARLRPRRLARERLDALLAGLTARERDVFDRLVDGVPTKSIAEELDLSNRTVEGYRARILEKMGVDSLAALINLYRSVN